MNYDFTYKRKPRKCPSCGSQKIATLLYGMPEYSKKLDRDIKESLIILAGCGISDHDPTWQCIDCNEKIYKAPVMKNDTGSGKRRQNETGSTTEELVSKMLESLGLIAQKPIPDSGIDLIVCRQENEDKTLNLQIKGRGVKQSNKRYRWFQLRTNKAQREHALDPKDAWREKVEKCDFFLLVSLYYDEVWVFPQKQVIELIERNKTVYGHRKNNMSGEQVEMDLDIQFEGKPLTELYKENKNNLMLIVEKLEE